MAYEAPGLDPPVPSADRLPLSGAEPGRETESAEAGGGAPARQEGPGRCALRGRHAPGGNYGTVSPGLSLLPVNSWTRLSQPGLCAGAWSCSSEEPGGRSPPRSSGARILGQSVRGGRARSLATPCSHTGVQGLPEPADEAMGTCRARDGGDRAVGAGSQGNALGQQRAPRATAATTGDPGSSPLRGRDPRPGSSPLWPQPPRLKITGQLRDMGLPPSQQGLLVTEARLAAGREERAVQTPQARPEPSSVRGVPTGLGRWGPQPRGGLKAHPTEALIQSPSRQLAPPSEPIRRSEMLLPRAPRCLPLGLGSQCLK